MSDRGRNVLFRVTPLLAVLAAATAAGSGWAHTTNTSTPSNGLVRCEIVATKSGGMTRLEGVIHADRAAAGTSDFRVSGGGSGGSTNIRQGGDFDLAAGESTTLGSVSLGGSYDATLEVTVNGETFSCGERI
ncbi:MAG: hypothetical protein K5872_20105 [Rhizobiaceae bacterium]|nr:hypothetical protein [Rhizobiaceae bacterium]MCV0408524.1 hypothetical protein [Rhizobiaceae bacterium]